MPKPESCLTERQVERIWERMRASYGAAFDRQWECPPLVEPEDHVRVLKQVWATELGGFRQNLLAIKYALDNLPEFPPNLPQFVAICKRGPALKLKELPHPKDANPEVVAKVVGGIAREQGHARDWIGRLQQRAKAGEKLTITQREMMARALHASGEVA